MDENKLLHVLKGGIGSGSWSGPNQPRFNWSPSKTYGSVDYGKSDPEESGVKSFHARNKHEMLKTMTPEQKASVKWYVGAGYWQINPYLRKGKALVAKELWPHGTPKWVLNVPINTTEELEKHVRNIVGSARPLKKPAILYRGIGSHRTYNVGEIVSDKAFTSTSLSEAAATDQFGPNVVRISVPAGTPAVWGEPYSREVILMPGAKFKVTRVLDENPNGTHIYAKTTPNTHGYELEYVH